MKVQCDVCEKAVATLICCADEAALCSACDARIHAANKLAGKHERVPLLLPPSQTKQTPLKISTQETDDAEQEAAASSIQRCDICQERISFFFCLEDRALLCRDCDVSIHGTNARAAKHRRFLLTGVRVGYAAIPTTATTATAAGATATTPSTSSSNSQDKPPPPPKRPASGSSSSAAAWSLLNNMMSSSMKRTAPAKVPQLAAAAAGAAANSSAALMKAPGTASVASDNHTRRRFGGKDAMNQLQNIHKVKRNSPSRVPQCTNLLKSTPGLSIQMRLSAGKVPFIAPVLSTVTSAGNNNNSNSNSNINDNINNANSSHNHSLSSTGRTSYNSSNITTAAGSSLNHNTTVQSSADMLHQYSPPSSSVKKRSSSSSSISQYFTEGIPGWKLDEVLLEDLAEPDDVGGGKVDSMSWESGPFGTDHQGDQEDIAEMRQLMMNMEGSPPYYYSSNEAEVPDIMMNMMQQQLPDQSAMTGLQKSPSPPTASGLFRGKPIHRHRLYHHDDSIPLFEDGVVPDISCNYRPLKRARNWLDTL